MTTAKRGFMCGSVHSVPDGWSVWTKSRRFCAISTPLFQAEMRKRSLNAPFRESSLQFPARAPVSFLVAPGDVERQIGALEVVGHAADKLARQALHAGKPHVRLIPGFGHDTEGEARQEARVGLEQKAEEVSGTFCRELDELHEKASKFPRRLRVYFEEWDDPLISGIRWVGELVRKLGGEDLFEELQEGTVARQRRVQPEEVIRRNPEVILASWCGKKVQIEKIKSRPGWEQIEAVKRNQIYEIKSADILQPGLSLLHGARQIFKIFDEISLPIPSRFT